MAVSVGMASTSGEWPGRVANLSLVRPDVDRRRIVTANRCKDCGDDESLHMKGHGRCYVLDCPCLAFVPDDRPATADNSRDLRPICGLGSAECITRPDLHRTITTLRAERDELRAALEACVTWFYSDDDASGEVQHNEAQIVMSAARNALTKGSNDE